MGPVNHIACYRCLVMMSINLKLPLKIKQYSFFLLLVKILREKKVFGKGRVRELNQSRETQSCTLQLKQKETKLIRI